MRPLNSPVFTLSCLEISAFGIKILIIENGDLIKGSSNILTSSNSSG